MREKRVVMGMPARVELVGSSDREDVEKIFHLWNEIEERFSTYKDSSEISRINRNELPEAEYSPEMREIFSLAKETNTKTNGYNELPEAEYSPEMREIFSLAKETNTKTNGYFDITRPDGRIDPSGLVKGWAIQKAAELAQKLGFDSYYLEIGGDIQTCGHDTDGHEWTIGIRNPFNREEIVKILYPHDAGVATSGSAVRGQHIYNPHNPASALADIASITVIGPDIYEADRFATAAFAMGRDGISFINSLEGFEAYAIDYNGIATMTDHIDGYLTP